MAMRQAGEDEKVCDSFAAELEGWISHILKRKIKFGKTKIRKTEEYSATPAAFVQKFLVRKNEFHIYFLIRDFPNIFIYVPQIFISSQIVNFSLFPSKKKMKTFFSFFLFFFSFFLFFFSGGESSSYWSEVKERRREVQCFDEWRHSEQQCERYMETQFYFPGKNKTFFHVESNDLSNQYNIVQYNTV